MEQTLSFHLEENIQVLKNNLPIGSSFDILTRELIIGNTPAYWIGISGFCESKTLQRLFSDLLEIHLPDEKHITDLHRFASEHISYAQISFSDDWNLLVQSLLSGPSLLLVDGFNEGIIIDARSYPVRATAEPEIEKVSRGARDGFVETMLFNTNLIRRRVRSPKLTFELFHPGSVSRTDVSIAYLDGRVSKKLLQILRKALSDLNVSSLTMGSKSLEELLVHKRWYNPMPNFQSTERPDVACSYLTEGHILLLVDNTPSVLILPCSLFHFTQSPEDYYKNPSVGTYFRLVRFGCGCASLLLLPLFLLLVTRYRSLSLSLGLLSSPDIGPVHLFVFVLAVEFILDLFRYSSVHSSGLYSGSLSIVGGLLIGDMAIRMNWASVEVIFYAALTLLATLSLSNLDLADALRLYRIFLLVTTGLFGLWGFSIGLLLVLISIATTPTFAGVSYLWPLFPFNGAALQTLLFRAPTFLAQPDQVWKRFGKKEPDHNNLDT